MHAEPEYIDSLDVGDHLQPGQFIFVEVSDTGCGMSEETRVRMFDPFFTTKATGRGLGLAATLGILRGHSGAIRVYSEEGQGTAIKLLLPAMANCEAPNRRTSGTISTAALQGTVLVVDDQELVRSMVRRTLERVGLQIIEAADGREALAIYERDGARIDGVLMDLTMPQLSGEETYAALRRLDPGVRVLLMSGYSAQDTTSRFVGKGLRGFLQKPFSVSELVSKVASLLAEPQGE